MQRPRPIALVALVCLSLTATACGSRRPMSDFIAVSASGAGAAVDGAAGDGAAGPDQGGTGANGTPADGSGGPVGAGGSSGSAAGATSGTAGGAAGGTASTGGGTSGTTGSAGTGGSTGGGGARAAGGSTGSTGSGSGGSAPGGAAAGGSSAAANTASDIGVTPTSIVIGNVVTKSGSFGPDQFTPFYYGAAAYFSDLNARGGINGRKVIFRTCDDAGTDNGNIQCTRRFVDDTKVFAFVGNDCLTCEGLKYPASKAVPSVGGLAIDSKDYSLPHTWRYSGNPYPQNGKIGYKGNLYYGTHQYRFFKDKFKVTKAAVVYYDNSAPSKNSGKAQAKALASEGIAVTEYPVNVALPQFDSAVLDMKARGIQAIWDSIDISGNQNLCKSIDSNDMKITAKVSTISTWAQSVGAQFSAPCRNAIFSVEDPGAEAYQETGKPEIAKFRAAMKRYFPDREQRMYQWTVDGWGSAMWFTDAAASCGANLTRACLEKFLNKPEGYTARGLWFPRNNNKIDFEKSKTLYRCIQVSQWQDSAKTWVTRGDLGKACYTTGYITSPAPL